MNDLTWAGWAQDLQEGIATQFTNAAPYLWNIFLMFIGVMVIRWLIMHFVGGGR